MPPQIDREAAARAVCAVLREAGHRALLAGGCVRDRLLGRNPKDYDIATSATPEEVAGLFPRTVPVGAAFGVTLVVWNGIPFEVAAFRSDGPYLDGRRPQSVSRGDERADALRRDFTVNALFLDPETDRVLDYVGGTEDLERRLIRAVGDPERRFAEDRLRMLRAVRFTAELGFDLDPATRNAATRMAHRLHEGVSAERVREELVKMLTCGAAGRALRLLDGTGLLGQILPEVTAMRGVAQPPEYHPEGDVLTHTLMMMDRLPAGCPPTLAMGALFHDAGKPSTQTHEDRIRFNLHEKVGARLAEAACRRLRFTNEETARITWLVARHMRAGCIPEMREGKRRLFAAEPGFGELLELFRLDCAASHGDQSTTEWVENYLRSLPEPEAAPQCPVTGHDLIALGLKPGPQFREILGELREGFIEGRFTSKEEAIALLAERLDGKG
ncbi:MAG: CCA tRNA nucleotidyltransferase [Candidatus Hydrogenedens sp.]|nr:CCA tRNA nucleotidyltransferase [Candidatus Hydrogenedentota bacterium]NLF58116.1 CCA tRNA nucleotidyltransferase [Candidatus Hydrogenedens sp.]